MLWLQYYLALRQCHSYVHITAQLGISNWGLIRRMYWLGGGGGLYLTSLCSTSPPQGEVGGKLGPSEIDVSSLPPLPLLVQR